MTVLRRQMFGVAVALGMFAMCATGARAGDIEIIANHSVKVTEISESEARDVFLGESVSVGGSRVVPVVLQKGAAQEGFLRLMGRTESAVQATWRKQVFTGKGAMPRAFDSEEALLAYVSATPGAIGYVSPGKAGAGVKVLKIK